MRLPYSPRSILLPLVMVRHVVVPVLLSVALNAYAQGANSPDQLLENYKSALKTKNVRSFVSLFELQREQDRATVESQFRRQSSMRIESAKIVPFSVHEQRYRKAMARLGKSPATTPDAWAEVAFASVSTPGGAVEQETSILAVVRRDGRYFIGW